MKTLPYGAWPSEISAQSVVAGVVGFSELCAHADNLYWLESRPEESGRSVLMARDPTGNVSELTPPPYSVRSRVHEYGGGAYCVSEHGIIFVNATDQNLYRISGSGEISALTRGEDGERFADFCFSRRGDGLLTVVEQHPADTESNTDPDPEARNFLGLVSTGSGKITVLHEAHDFYSCPRLSADGRRVAFVAWDHPNMPWDGSLLYTAELSDDDKLNQLMLVAGGALESVIQPRWQEASALLFLSDRNGFWNPYRFDDSGLYPVLEDGADYGQPPWVFGQREYCAIDQRHIAAVRRTELGDELVLIDTISGMATPLTSERSPWRRIEYVTAYRGNVAFVGSTATQSPAIELLRIADQSHESLKSAGGAALDPQLVSGAEALTFPTRDGGLAHGYFYPPGNPRYAADEDDKPPLLVMSHGGPTSASDSALNMRVQYYTSRGWAVLDVNYRGSSGFGREYRCALNGHWGELDVTDCEDGVRYLADNGRVDGTRIAIRGGSAGGFTTLAALTTTTTFACGASHYGIGDLNALAADTHKFESRYLHTLLGDDDMLTTRSPINHVAQLSCPVIFFQGGQDKVVPPNQAELMIQALRAKHIPVAYVLFEEEAHGFRIAANIVTALESEYGFFCRIFGIRPADRLPHLDVENLADPEDLEEEP